MPWLHKPKKFSRFESGELVYHQVSRAKSSASNATESMYLKQQQHQQQQQQLQQQLQQQQKAQGKLQWALDIVMEALQGLKDKQAQEQQQQNISSLRRKGNYCRVTERKTNLGSTYDEDYGATIRSLQLYLNNGANSSCLGFSSAAKEAVVTNGLHRHSVSTFASDKLDTTSDDSKQQQQQQKQQCCCATRREFAALDADILSRLTSDDLRASDEDTPDDKNQRPLVNLSTKQTCVAASLRVGNAGHVKMAAERARPISSTQLQQPAKIIMGYSVVASNWNDSPSALKRCPAVLFVSQPTVTIRPPVRVLNGQLAASDADDVCHIDARSSDTFSVNAPFRLEATQKDYALGESEDEPIVKTGAQIMLEDDCDLYSKVAAGGSKTRASDAAIYDEESNDSDEEDIRGTLNKIINNRGKWNQSTNNSLRRIEGPINQQLQTHSVVESKLLERTGETFQPAEAAYATPSSLRGLEPPSFGKVELLPEQPRLVEHLSRSDSLMVANGGIGGGQLSFSSEKSAATLEIFDNDDERATRIVKINSAVLNQDAAGTVSSCYSCDVAKSTGLTRLFMTLDRAHRRMEGLSSHLECGASDDQPVKLARSSAYGQQQGGRQRASVETLEKMLQHFSFVSRSSQPQAEEQDDSLQQSAFLDNWCSQNLRQDEASLAMPEDQTQCEFVPESLIVSTAASLMTLSQSLQQCVFEIEATVSRLNDSLNG